MALLWFLMSWALAAPSTTACDAVAAAVDRVWTARAVAEAVAPAWPGWRPTLMGVRYHTADGYRLQIGRSESAACPGLAVPARILGTRRPPRSSYVGLERRGGTFWLDIVEGRDGLPLEDLVSAVVHQLFHVYQYRTHVRFNKVNGHSGEPDAAWAMHHVAPVPSEVHQMVAIAGQLLDHGLDAQTLQRLVSARQRHFTSLDAAHPRLKERVRLMEEVEGTAAYVEHQVVIRPQARQLLIEAGVPVSRLDPSTWRAAALDPGSTYPHATGFANALILDATGLAWKDVVFLDGFDGMLEVAVLRALR